MGARSCKVDSMEAETGNLSIVGGVGLSREQLEGAMAKVPPERFDPRDGSPKMLPHEPTVDVCRICGEVAALNEEHLPPRGAFNKGTTAKVDVDLVIGSDSWTYR